MPGTIPAARQHLIDDIAKLARRTRGAPLPLPAFVQAYYRGVGEEDLQARDAAAFAASAAGTPQRSAQCVVPANPGFASSTRSCNVTAGNRRTRSSRS